MRAPLCNAAALLIDQLLAMLQNTAPGCSVGAVGLFSVYLGGGDTSLLLEYPAESSVNVFGEILCCLVGVVHISKMLR